MTENKTVYVLTDVYGEPKFATPHLDTAEIWAAENPGHGHYEIDLI